MFSKTDKIRQWVKYDGEGRYKTVEQLRQDCFDSCEDEEILDNDIDVGNLTIYFIQLIL